MVKDLVNELKNRLGEITDLGELENERIKFANIFKVRRTQIINKQIESHKTYASQLAERMVKFNLKEQDLSKRLGITKQAVSNWLTGISSPTVLNRKRIDEFFKGLENEQSKERTK